MILVDTNVLGQLCHLNDLLRPVSRSAIQLLRRRGTEMVIVPQTLYEFWVVATRPASANGLEMPFDRARRWFEYSRHMFPLLEETPEVLDRWYHLMQTSPTHGRRAHDARLAAAMLVHGIYEILTFNVKDFVDYPVKIVDPATLK
jgi:predicted nucleic acid-binding protein